jgi:hypothetical protein
MKIEKNMIVPRLRDTFLVLLLSFSLSGIICLSSCNSESTNRKKVEGLKKDNQDTLKKSLTILDSSAFSDLISKYNPFVVLDDTIKGLYTFRIKELIKSNAGIVGSIGILHDIDNETNGHTATIELRYLEGIGRFYCDSTVFNKLIKSYGFKKGVKTGFFILKISDMIPIDNEVISRISNINKAKAVSEASKPTFKTILDVTNILINYEERPYYIFYGKILDFSGR